MYYLLLEGAQAGPFALAQLIEMWRTHRVNALTLYWEEGNTDWLPLHNIASLLEMPVRPPSPTPSSVVPPPLATGAAPARIASSATAGGEEVLFDEHPTLWKSAGALFWGVLLTPVLIGIPILVHVFWSRSRTRYRVTSRRVSVETGIFTRSSRELRIEDIRSIAARANMFGIGDIEFSTAARDDAEVTFLGLSHIERVRDLVKQLQNGLR
jgi:membrane protein YdbS with pleckstrin-like domain